MPSKNKRSGCLQSLRWYGAGYLVILILFNPKPAALAGMQCYKKDIAHNAEAKDGEGIKIFFQHCHI